MNFYFGDGLRRVLAVLMFLCISFLIANSELMAECVEGPTTQFPISFSAHGGGLAYTLQGNNSPAGIYFNLTNTSSDDLIITGFGIRFGNPDFGVVTAPQTVNVFTAPTFAGNETNPGAWTPISANPITTIEPYFATGTGTLSQLDLNENVLIPAGQTLGFHLFCSTAGIVFDYTWSIQPPIDNSPWTFTGGPTSYGQFSNLFDPGNNAIANIQIQTMICDEATTYIMIYNGNGNTEGTAPVDLSSPYEAGSIVTVLDEGDLARSGYTFNNWNTAANGSGTSYAPGATFNMPETDVVLYAQWSSVPQPIPTLSEWGTIIMSLILAGSAIWMMRRRQVS